MRVKNELDEDEQGLLAEDPRAGKISAAASDEKLFVGGLSWETSQENLQRYFSRYGDVIDCVVMKNSESGRSRGFGFVTFADPANVTLVLQNGPHQLDGRTIDPKPCNPRTLQKPKRSSSYPKVFLGGLPSNVTETDLRTYFMRFGKVMEVVIMYDQEKKKSRGFGFLSFEDDEAVERCVQEHFVNLSGKQVLDILPNIAGRDHYTDTTAIRAALGNLQIQLVEIKKAEPRDSNKMNDNSGANQWGPPQNAGHMTMGGGMGMGTPSGQMGGPMGGMGPMGPGNMMQGYQGWGSTPQTQGYPGQWGPSNQSPMNGYGTPSGPGGYQSWGAPPGPQGQQMAPPQWGSNYAPPQQTGYGSYGPNQSGYGSNWNWNMPQNGPTATGGPPATGAPGPQGDMYSRGAAAAGAAPTGPTPPGTAAGAKGANDYAGYGGYGYQQDSTTYGGGRSYDGSLSGAQGTGADSISDESLSDSMPMPIPALSSPPRFLNMLFPSMSEPGYMNLSVSGSDTSYSGAPGPQRGNSYTTQTPAPSFHPYRRV